MGFGEYSHSAHVALVAKRRSHRSVPTFATRVDPLLSPHRIEREARDSDEHPDSLAIAFVMDVTGSMGRIAQHLANETLPDFMAALLEARVEHPQVCFMAVGHAEDRAPLQVGQFESTASMMDAWLRRIWLEKGGAGQHEAYELAMYMCAHHIHLDSVERRGRRGFLFLTVDVAPNPAVSAVQVRRVLGREVEADVPMRDLIVKLQSTFEPFVLLAAHATPQVERAWRDLLGDRVVRLAEPEDAAHVAAGLISLLEGSVNNLSRLVHRFETAGMHRKRASRVARALVPFAASVGRDGAPRTTVKPLALPTGDAPSGMDR